MLANHKLPKNNEFYNDSELLLKLVEPMNAMLAYFTLALDASSRIQKDPSQSFARAAHAGKLKILNYVKLDEQHLGVVEKFAKEFDVIFDETAALSLDILAKGLEDSNKNLSKVCTGL